MKRALLALGLVAVAACAGEITDPAAGDKEFALVSIDGGGLPVTLMTDYDISVSVMSDVIRLRPDSTFLEIAQFRGTGLQAELIATDSVAGTYTVSGKVVVLLTTSAQASWMDMVGDSLVVVAGKRFVYARR